MGTNPCCHNTVSDPRRRKLHFKNCILTEDLKSEDCIKAPPSCRHQVAPVDLCPQHQKFHTKSRSAPKHRSLEPVKDSVWCHRHSLGCLSSVWLSGWISYKRCSLGCLSGASPWHGAQWERGNVNPQPSHNFLALYLAFWIFNDSRIDKPTFPSLSPLTSGWRQRFFLLLNIKPTFNKMTSSIENL